MTPYKLLQYVWRHPANRGRRLRAIGATVGWQLNKRTLKRAKLLPVFDSLTLKCYPDSFGAGVMVYTSGWPEYDEMHFVKRYLREGDSFVDVGTNIGIFTLLAASCVGPTGHVLSLEAGRRAYERLMENIQLNRLENVVEAWLEAVGPENGTLRFLQSHDLINRIATESEQQQGLVAWEEVASVKLDDRLANRRYAMGKIDIEGAEPLAFQGSTEMLRTGNPPVWLLELKARLLSRFQYTPEALAQQLSQAGYCLGIYDADRRTLDFPPRPWERHGDVLAIYEPALTEVRARLAGAAVATAVNTATHAE